MTMKKERNMKNSYRSSRRLRIVAQRIVVGIACVSLFSCSNEDFLTTPSDESREVSFSIGTDMQLQGKASSVYRAWDEDRDPTTIGVHAIYNQQLASKAKFFDNERVYRNEGKWKYDNLKYWADYTWCTSFDFFGYMPYSASGELTSPEANTFTLSYPVSLTNSVINTVANVPLICNKPVHKETTGSTISYQMDQTLAGFRLKFVMAEDTRSEKMAVIRDFVIKEVHVKGAVETLPVRGTVSRTYTWSAGAWSAGGITWSSLTTNASALNYKVPFVDYDGAGTIYGSDGVKDSLRIGYSNSQRSQWGADFYAIPSATFTPTIEITYDVEVADIDMPGTFTKTRRNLTASIELNSTNFETYTSGQAGVMNDIIITIAPEYLYVLADADQKLSWLKVQE